MTTLETQQLQSESAPVLSAEHILAGLADIQNYVRSVSSQVVDCLVAGVCLVDLADVVEELRLRIEHQETELDELMIAAGAAARPTVDASS